MYKMEQYLNLIENKEKVHSGSIDFNLFLKMSISYHKHNQNENITKAHIVKQYIKYQEGNKHCHNDNNTIFQKLKDYLENIVDNAQYQKEEQCEKQINQILDEIFEDIVSWQDYELEPIHMTLNDIYEDEIESQLILLDQHFYYKLYKHVAQRDLYFYHTGDETKILYTDERIYTINQFLEQICHTR